MRYNELECILEIPLIPWVGYRHTILTGNIVYHLDRCVFQSSPHYSLWFPSFLSISFHLYKTGVITWFNLQLNIILQGWNTFCKCQIGKLKKSIPASFVFNGVTIFFYFPRVALLPLIYRFGMNKVLRVPTWSFFLLQYVPYPRVSEYMWEFSQFQDVFTPNMY